MAAAVPVVERPDHRDAPGIRRPDREMHAGRALMVDQVRAELVEQPEMRALGDVIVVHRAEHRPEGIGVGDPPLAAGIARAVAQRLALGDRQLALEEAGIVAARQLADFFAGQCEGRRRFRRAG